jgi:small-conductance mechanosensitive channel
MDFFGIRLLGFNSENGRKLLFTIGLVILVVVIRSLLNALSRLILGGEKNERARFWSKQIMNLFFAAVIILGFLSIWFDDPTRLTTAAGLITAGLAFALQKVITAIAGYFVILRSQAFTVGDRILMGGVRGDVMRLGFIQTTIMEMGQSPGEQKDDPSVWVKSRQFTGRIVTVTNDKVFDHPVYNYTSEFPYLWEEIILPISYRDDYTKAEKILLAAAHKHAITPDHINNDSLENMKQHFFVTASSLEPQVFVRLTDNWIELSLRFITHDHGAREIKDKMSRDILRDLNAAGIGIASTTFEITGLPPLQTADGAHLKVGSAK